MVVTATESMRLAESYPDDRMTGRTLGTPMIERTASSEVSVVARAVLVWSQ